MTVAFTAYWLLTSLETYQHCFTDFGCFFLTIAVVVSVGFEPSLTPVKFKVQSLYHYHSYLLCNAAAATDNKTHMKNIFKLQQHKGYTDKAYQASGSASSLLCTS